MNLPRYFKPIENCYIKIHHVHFNDFNIILKGTRNASKI